jgi:hypothetical protein
VPAWRWPLVGWCCGRDDRQQRKDDSNQWKHKARHSRTIDGWLLRGDSNLGARSSETAALREKRKFLSGQFLTGSGRRSRLPVAQHFI